MTENNAVLSYLDKLKAHGNKPALFDGDGNSISFTGIADQAQMLSEQFTSAIGKASRVITILQNQAATTIYLLGLCLENIAAPLNPESSPEEIAEALKGENVVAILTDHITKALEAFAQDLDLALIEIQPTQFKCALKFHRHQKQKQASYLPSDTCLILQTSGSTGNPKRVPITRNAMMNSANIIANSLNLSAQDKVVHMLPMFHIGAILDLFIVPMLKGGQVHVAPTISIEALTTSLRRSEATWFQAVPTMLKALLKIAEQDQLAALSPSLRFIRSVSADLAPAIQEDLEKRIGNIPIVQMYGMTETAGQIASNPVNIQERKLGSVGKVNGPNVSIVDRFGNSVSTGKEGEICVKGPTVTAGYEATDNSQHMFGQWLRTGDLGRLDEDGFLFLTGRVKDIINRGGEKISTIEIEQCLYELSNISQCAVYPITHPTLGEDVGVSVVAENLTQDGILVHLSAKLSPHKIPRKIVFMDALPKLGSGKIDKQKLRQSQNLIQQSLNRHEPETALGKELAAIWSQTLKTKTPSKSDDFFDAGGDSLLAQNFVFSLEDLMKTTLPANLLFEAPTFGELEKSLHSIKRENYTSPLPDDVFQIVKNYTASWPGARRSATSLITESNGIGSQTPIFFCAADADNFTDLIKELGSEYPFYAMRTLSKLKQENLENMHLLAQHYADEITDIAPQGPLVIAGYCKGAVVAKLTSDELAKRGRATDLFIVLDRVLKESHHGVVLNAWSLPSFGSVRTDFLNPEFGLSKLFPNENLTNFDIPYTHETCTRGEGAKLVAQQIKQAIQNINPATQSNVLFNDLPNRQSAYKAVIKTNASRFAKAHQKIHVKVSITNTSHETWHPTHKSGFRILAKWERPLNNNRPLNHIAGHCDINEEVPIGRTVECSFPVTFPDSKSPLNLKVDMVDEGICWFSDGNSSHQANRHLVLRKFW